DNSRSWWFLAAATGCLCRTVRHVQTLSNTLGDNNMKILLVGATGVIGRLLLPLLVQAGHTVLGTTRRPERRDQIAQLGGTPVILNALDRAIMFYMFERMEPEVVIHQMTDLAERDFAANARLRVEGTRNLVDASRFVGVQQMIAQSISWVCVPGEGP